MVKHPSFIRASAVLLFAASAIVPAHAQLPTMADEKWLGFFAVHSSNRQLFSIDSVGNMLLEPVNSGKPGAMKYSVSITPKITETSAAGRTTHKKVKTESLETSDSTTGKLQKVTYRGKVTGDAAFEITAEQSRDIIFLSGRLLDPGKVKNPQLAILVSVPSLYSGTIKSVEGLERRDKKKAEKALADKLRGDRATVKKSNGELLKLSTDEGENMTGETFSGPGITSVELDCSVFDKRTLAISTSTGTSMGLIKKQEDALLKGFDLLWMIDSTKDPSGKAQLAIQFR